MAVPYLEHFLDSMSQILIIIIHIIVVIVVVIIVVIIIDIKYCFY